MTAADIALNEALEQWREDKTITTYGYAYAQDIGPALIMPNEILDRIVLCAHDNKLVTAADFTKEILWTKAAAFAVEIIKIVHQHIPPPTASALVSTTLQFHTNQTTLSGTSLMKKARHCSSCGGTDHICEYRRNTANAV